MTQPQKKPVPPADPDMVASPFVLPGNRTEPKPKPEHEPEAELIPPPPGPKRSGLSVLIHWVLMIGGFVAILLGLQWLLG